VLVERGLITPEQLQEALSEQQLKGLSLGRILLSLGYVTEAQLAALLAVQRGIDFVSLADYPIDPSAAATIPDALARRYALVPVGFEGERLVVAMSDPSNVVARDDIQAVTGRDLKVIAATHEDIEEALNRLQSLDNEASELLELAAEPEEEPDVEVKGEDAPVVRAIDLLIAQAVQQRASDIHIEPRERDVRIRYRIDGVLHEKSTVPKNLHNAMVSRLKIMADMDIAERRVPQDGRVTVKVGSHPIDIRCATMPSVWGEKVVMRILDRSSTVLALEELGFLPNALERYQKGFRRPYGMILVTGPTGSGKSTTLYATLNILNDPQKNVITVEDPVEYRLSGLTQVQVNPKAGLHFANALRAILRSDPDIVMVGEIRDRETAMIAVEAALTGHLVLSTLHTNDAASAVTRLVEMGVEPFLVASALECVLGQRLARRLCPKCKTEYTPSRQSLAENQIVLKDKEAVPELYMPKGCRSCAQTGYRGRVALVEVLTWNEEIERLTVDRKPSEEIKRAAVREGMLPLRDDGIEKVKLGLTSVQEVFRVA
jgi:type IV pilus assembly protein PilB